MFCKSTNKGFTLIELLVVIAIIGILSAVVLASLNEARERGRIASVVSNLRNLHAQAMIYHAEAGGTFAGMCNYPFTSADESTAPFITALESVAGEGSVGCVVRTSAVPAGGSHFLAADALEQKNFGVAVYYDETHYAVDASGVMVLDTANTGGTASWTNAKAACWNSGKKLPSIEILKAIYDIHGNAANAGFAAGSYWSSTGSSVLSRAYFQNFNNGNVVRNDVGNARYVRCAS